MSNLHESWEDVWSPIFKIEKRDNLWKFLMERMEAGAIIYPPGNEVFTALNLCPFDQVRVVVIGQDPYHGPDQGHGLAFSVKPGVKNPPSLQNIFKELKSDTGIERENGYLIDWAEQGVLLLNAVLTVEKGQPNSHAGKGWEVFTDKVIEKLNNEKEDIVYMLWGRYAQKKGEKICRVKNLVLESAHPSPFSAGRGFFGNKCFSRCNEYLITKEKEPIKW